MNLLKYILLLAALMFCFRGFSQTKPSGAPTIRPLTIEPGAGIHTNFGIDLLLTNLIQWNPHKRLSIAAYSAFNINNLTQRYFNHIKTNYNYSINQKFGIGTSLYGKKNTHSLLLMAGLKYTRYEETLDSDALDKVSARVKSISPDYGLMYSLKRGWKNCFFTFRTYLPLYPWPTKGSNILYIDGNMSNIALEFGIGMKII